jgi:hypothetical protein
MVHAPGLDMRHDELAHGAGSIGIAGDLGSGVRGAGVAACATVL